MRLQLAAVFLLLSPGAQAADITVYSPGIVNAPLTKLAQAWTAETGNKVTFAGFNVGRIRTAVGQDAAGDVVVAPISDFTDFAPKLAPGSQRALGRVPFGLAVKAGGPHPDISSHEKFVAVIKEAGVLAFANPQVGSLTGSMVEEMLKRPEFAGVERRPIKGLIGDAIARGDAEFGDLRLRLHLGFGEVALVGLGDVLHLRGAPAELHGIIAVRRLGARRHHLHVVHVQHGDGHMGAVVFEKPGHAQLLREQSSSHYTLSPEGRRVRNPGP